MFYFVKRAHYYGNSKMTPATVRQGSSEVRALRRYFQNDRYEDARWLNDDLVVEAGVLAIAVGHGDGKAVRADLRCLPFEPTISAQRDPRRELAAHLVGIAAAATGGAQLMVHVTADCK